ncbi:hypothetical protein CLU79DRAFT_724566 [Phycomyces nitens]|nr:hypothetical protein CLU79DRAFT_724566 [Phycomyces nitens]
MSQLPTVRECYEWINEHCASLLNSKVIGEKDLLMVLDSARILISALDAPISQKTALQRGLQKLRQQQEGENDANNQNEISWTITIQELQKLFQNILPWIPFPEKTSNNHINNTIKHKPNNAGDFKIEEARILPHRYSPADYASMGPDPVDAQAIWFRQRFVGKSYISLIGPMASNRDTHKENVIVSVVQEYNPQGYSIIVRHKESNEVQVVSESTAKATEIRLESANQGHLLYCGHSDRKQRPLRSLSSAIISSTHSHPSKRLRAALLSIYPTVDLRLFKELTAEATILAGLEKELIIFDEMNISQDYKFGVLSVKGGQTTEEEWFSNSGLSGPCEQFLEMMGSRVELKGYGGYAAGLDTQTGESGEVSYVSSWENKNIMYHVGPLMPLNHTDRQQVNRKKYIGNDIVCLVFLEDPEAIFDPNQVHSQFLHVYVLISPETTQDKQMWRVQVMANKKIADFGPWLPSPPLLNTNELYSFLTLKLINAENAALKSDKFASMATKTRAAMMRSIVEVGLNANNVTRSFSTGRLLDGSYNQKQSSFKNRGYSFGERPKSAGAASHQRNSRTLKNLCTSETPRSMTPETIVPMPTSSRSNVLKDLRSGFGRRMSSTQAMLPLMTTEMSLLCEHDNNSTHSCTPTLNHRNSSSMSSKSQQEFQPEHNTVLSVSNHPPIKPNHSKSSSSPGEGSIRSRAQHLMTSVMGRRTQRTVNINIPGIPRSKTFINDSTISLQSMHRSKDKPEDVE